MKVDVDVLGSPSLISFMVSVDVKQHESRSSITSSRAVRYPRRAAVTTGNNDSNVPIGPSASAVRDVARSEQL